LKRVPRLGPGMPPELGTPRASGIISSRTYEMRPPLSREELLKKAKAAYLRSAGCPSHVRILTSVEGQIPWRYLQLHQLYGYVWALLDVKRNRAEFGKLFGFHDNRGELTVIWYDPPTIVTADLVKRAWVAMGESGDKVHHDLNWQGWPHDEGDQPIVSDDLDE